MSHTETLNSIRDFKRQYITYSNYHKKELIKWMIDELYEEETEEKLSEDVSHLLHSVDNNQ